MNQATIYLAPTAAFGLDFYKATSVVKAVELMKSGQYEAQPPIEVEMDGEDAAEEMFDLTNNPYRQAERLEKYGRGRSLSVGDIVAVGDGSWLCASVGWVEL